MSTRFLFLEKVPFFEKRRLFFGHKFFFLIFLNFNTQNLLNYLRNIGVIFVFKFHFTKNVVTYYTTTIQSLYTVL